MKSSETLKVKREKSDLYLKMLKASKKKLSKLLNKSRRLTVLSKTKYLLMLKRTNLHLRFIKKYKNSKMTSMFLLLVYKRKTNSALKSVILTLRWRTSASSTRTSRRSIN